MMERIGQPERPSRGSALILTVVLTSLLAIVGVLFVMASRIDKMATSAASDNRDLDSAVETVITEIGEMLVVDVPGVTDDQEYYDYPDANNVWLASLEPYASGGEYYWRQISNIGSLPASETADVPIDVVGEWEPIDVNATGTNADADGDGVGDARWFRVPGIVSSRGRPMYAAVRIVDNGGMLNVNTGFKFDGDHPDPNRVDGSRLFHVNVMALAAGPGDAPQPGDEEELLSIRANYTTNPAGLSWDDYERLVTWRYLDVLRNTDPNGYVYTPFDMSDELELRYRYLLNHRTQTRVEEWGQLKTVNTKSMPVDYAGEELDDWFIYAAGGGQDPNYTYRHLTTTYNMDRVLLPDSLDTTEGRTLQKKLSVNQTSDRDLEAIRDAVAAALAEADPLASAMEISEQATQIAVNLRDFVDDDDEVSLMASSGTQEFIGFERPCVYISELACRWVRKDNETHKSYAIELYMPYPEDTPPNPETAQWRVRVNNIESYEQGILWSGTRQFHVLMAEDPDAPLEPRVQWQAEPADSMPKYGYRADEYPRATQELDSRGFEEGATVFLERLVQGKWKQVDSVTVPAGGWMQADGNVRSLQRDVSDHKTIWGLWSDPAERPGATLGNASPPHNYVDPNDTDPLQAHPKNAPLRNIGEIGMVFATSAYYVPEDATPADILIDLANPRYARLFNYLTVMEPNDYGRSEEETRVMGRINVNTASAFVLGQLPWMRYPDGSYDRAQAIVANRTSRGAFESIGDLTRVPQMALLPDNRGNLHETTPRGPDLTEDTALDDYEERDLIFTRISDLATVRSDVYTAYILVRIGKDGPQKRLIALLDRSQVRELDDRVRVAAHHLVPDPR